MSRRFEQGEQLDVQKLTLDDKLRTLTDIILVPKQVDGGYEETLNGGMRPVTETEPWSVGDKLAQATFRNDDIHVFFWVTYLREEKNKVVGMLHARGRGASKFTDGQFQEAVKKAVDAFVGPKKKRDIIIKAINSLANTLPMSDAIANARTLETSNLPLGRGVVIHSLNPDLPVADAYPLVYAAEASARKKLPVVGAVQIPRRGPPRDPQPPTIKKSRKTR